MSTIHPPFLERDSEELLTLSEVAEILKVPVNTLRWWRQRNTGPEFFKMGRDRAGNRHRRLFVLKKDAQRRLDEHAVEPQEPLLAYVSAGQKGLSEWAGL